MDGLRSTSNPDEKNAAVKLHLISDFNLDTLGNCLANDESSPQVTITAAPFGQVFPALLQPESDPSDFALVWTLPEKIIPAFGEALNSGKVDEASLARELNEFADCLQAAQKHFRAIFVVSWTLPPYRRGNALLSLRKNGPRKLLLKLNLMLAERLEDSSSIYLLDGQPHAMVVSQDSVSAEGFRNGSSRFEVGDVSGAGKWAQITDC
jgi:hypothetical protein